MASDRTYRLGDLQLQIMKVLWQVGSASVAEVHEQLGTERLGTERLAYTTVATMLRKMEDRHLVRHRQEQRRFIYQAAVPAQAVTQSMADDLVDRLFEGSLADTVSHLLQTREVGPQELDRLERMIQERKQH
ncbi:MAG: BlaI/MecI/CopY family transcriptional regulator [Planctomycetes bacterium]|nr:BlaI/MecI/CopY family transcriptional regulator [Planctomycetota bacterium]